MLVIILCAGFHVSDGAALKVLWVFKMLYFVCCLNHLQSTLTFSILNHPGVIFGLPIWFYFLIKVSFISSWLKAI